MLTLLARGVFTSAAISLIAVPALAEGIHSGSWTSQITKQEARPLGSPEHLLVAQVMQGTNKSTGSDPKLDGAQVLFSETVELKQGNGPQHGLISMVDAKGSHTAEYTGKITTTMVDGQPRTGGEGTWKGVSGTGAYVDDKGTGTYRFTMTSPTDVKGEWKENTKSASR